MKRLSNLAASAGLILLLAAGTNLSAENLAPEGVLGFAAAQCEREYSEVPREVLAFYYTWYGLPERHGHWVHWGGEDKAARTIPESTHYPARGAYDSFDPEIMQAHISEAQAHGVTGFIATWWGQNGFEDRVFKQLLEVCGTNSFKLSVYWETAPGKGAEQIKQAVDDLAYLIKNYGSHPAFLKVDSKPVIFAYGRVMNEVPFESWPTIIREARAKAGDFLLIADGYRDPYARLFDGIHIYNNCGDVAGKSPEQLRNWSKAHYRDAVSLARTHSKISCVTVIPGYDDTKIRKPGINAARQDGKTYKVLWEEAMKSNPDWVLITSWNEWHEGSEIEASFEDGDKYLKLTQQYAKPFQRSKPAKPTSPKPQDTAAAQELIALFKGKTIGVLPGYGEAAFFLSDVGLSVKELTWEDVVTAAVFNPTNVPLVLHAGGEHYRSSVRSTNDVMLAIQGYLAQGGFLISIPNQPFPFYYDDVTQQPKTIANQIGLPVQGGWEKPPGGELIFKFDTNLISKLPGTARFPETGDLRWRPARRIATKPQDEYVALARLRDANGTSFGDGIAFVRHHTPPLAGGMTLYCWMRMPDVVESDVLLNSLFKFAGERLAHPE